MTGPDGASHHGMWDMTLTSVVPGLHLAAPRDGSQVAAAIRCAVDIDDGPSVIRFPKGAAGSSIDAVRQVGTVDVLAEPDTDDDVDVLVVGVGSMAGTALTVGDKLTAGGRRVRVVDPVWALPVSKELVALAGRVGAVAVIEDNVAPGAVGTQVGAALADAGLTVRVHGYGLPKTFIAHANRGQVLDAVGLTPDHIVADLEPRLG